MSNYDGFEVVLHQNGTEVRLKELAAADAECQHKLADELLDFVKTTQPSNLVISFRDVGKCTTGAINGLLAIRRLMGAERAAISLCELGGDVRRTLNVLNLADSLFPVYESLNEALAAHVAGDVHHDQPPDL